MSSIVDLLNLALSAREAFLEEGHSTAFRMFNGFLEGCPVLCIDIYARTALIHNYASASTDDPTDVALAWIQIKLPWVQSIIVKNRFGKTNTQKNSF